MPEIRGAYTAHCAGCGVKFSYWVVQGIQRDRSLCSDCYDRKYGPEKPSGVWPEVLGALTLPAIFFLVIMVSC